MGNVDVSLFKDSENIYDFAIANGDFVTNDSFETSIQGSIFEERRADPSEVPTAEFRRGFWGNVTNRVEGFERGSKLWLLEQARRTPTTLNKAIDFAKEGLQWFIDREFADSVTVNGEFIDPQGIRLEAIIFRPNDKVTRLFSELWNNTTQV